MPDAVTSTSSERIAGGGLAIVLDADVDVAPTRAAIGRAAAMEEILTGEPVDATLRARSTHLPGEVLASEDTKEGLAAFVERRPPRWAAR